MCEGETPANVIVESVTPLPAAGQEPLIVIRNTGGQLANITGWRLFAGEGNTTEVRLLLSEIPDNSTHMHVPKPCLPK